MQLIPLPSVSPTLQVVSENQRKVLVLEDDAYFKSYFTKGLYSIMRETKLLALNWDYM